MHRRHAQYALLAAVIMAITVGPVARAADPPAFPWPVVRDPAGFDLLGADPLDDGVIVGGITWPGATTSVAAQTATDPPAPGAETPTPTPVPPVATPTPTLVPLTATPTPTPVPTPTPTPVPTPSPTPVPTPTPSPSPSPTATPSPSPSATPSPTPTPAPTVVPTTFRIVAFPIVTLSVGQRPYDDLAAPDLTAVPVVADANGVPLRQVGINRVYAPVTVAQWGLGMMVGFDRTGDPEYLRRAKLAADVFRAIGVRSGKAIYLPYTFSFALHGMRTQTLRAPWYSAMAQGQALSLMTRIYGATKDPADLATAQGLYLSLLHKGRGTAPWVTIIDRSRYLWLEEYAESTPEHTLNGMMFAMFGLYDYYEATHDRNALNLLRGALTTIRYNSVKYRNPGSISAYCLAHRTRSLKYHHIHIAQLTLLTQMTGAPYFASLARLLKRDAW